MKRRTENLLTIFGIISFIMGLAVALPSYLNENYFGFGISLFFVIIGGILFAIAFGE